jgi:serine/threonine protein kinase
VLVFPGDNDGFLLKLADFGLGFLKRETGEELIPSRIANSPALAQVGTVWIRAPEVDSQTAHDPAAVDVFSLGMVLVDLLTDGGGEEIRWEVAYQKKDPVTGKNTLVFGLNTDHLREILSRKSNKRPAGLVALAVECSSEDPNKRPTLSVVSQRLGLLLERYTQSENVHAHLQEQLARRESQALVASAAIKSTEGMEMWAIASENLKHKEVPSATVWRHVLELFARFGSALSSSEADVLAEAVGYTDEGKIDASLFAHIWERLEPIVNLFRHEQIGHLWRNSLCSLLSDRTTATTALSAVHSRSAIVLRISNTFAGKLTISTMNSVGKPAHQLVAIDAYAVILGKGVDCRTFEGINDLFLYLVSCGFKELVGRDNRSVTQLERVAGEMPRPPSSLLAESGDSYTLQLQQAPKN